jgi:methylmalonyl-CoA mutase cobalamin-binding subunit
LESSFTEGTNNILVSYTAGYADEDIPGVIKLTILRIAGLMLVETGGNIGATSKSFDMGGSRTFVNTKDYAPYLKVLDTIRIERI